MLAKILDEMIVFLLITSLKLLCWCMTDLWSCYWCVWFNS